jgi:hypothetical protein
VVLVTQVVTQPERLILALAAVVLAVLARLAQRAVLAVLD